MHAATPSHFGTAALPGDGSSAESAASVAAGREPKTPYLAILTWSFTFFSSARILAYLPTIWAIQATGDASQHSLWTWLTWFGSNLTMAAWLYEQNGRRLGRAVTVNLANASMCAVIVALIVACRW